MNRKNRDYTDPAQDYSFKKRALPLLPLAKNIKNRNRFALLLDEKTKN
jgi:hypothetical protein